MKLISQGFKPDEGSWMEKRFMCDSCETIIEPEPSDKGHIESYEHKPDYRSLMIMGCPICLRTTMWRECAESPDLPPVFIPSFL